MVDKKEVIEGWPLVTGDYSVGDVKSPVAVVTLGSKMNDEIVNVGAAIAGPLHTENLGIEKVVANVVANPNLRYVIVCGSEVQGHITGKTMEALYEKGIDPEKKAIIDSPGAIPFVENLPIEAVEHFQKQVELISMINNENIDEIADKIQECNKNDPGAYSEELIVELTESDDEEEETENNEIEFISNETIDSLSIQLQEIETKMRILKMEIKQIAVYDKLFSGYYAGKIEGIVIGFILTLCVLLIIKWKVGL